MEIEGNPFQQTIPVGTEPITSITVESNLDFLVIPDVIVGAQAILNLNAETNVPALKVFGTGLGIGTPSMISLVPQHIPNIEISQVNGLQDSLNTNVQSIESSNASLLALNNGVGDYTLTPVFGTTSSSFAIGNDARFSASVTGLRKSAGTGSTDTAAVAKTDYWDTTLVAPGTKGLVPDPVSSTGKYFKDDGTWSTVPSSGTVTSVALTTPAILSVAGSPITTSGTLAVTLATQTANTVFAGPTTGAAAAPTFRAPVYADVSPLVGTGASNIAVGNDTRFPASVTGIRLSSGEGSTDVAATPNVDYASAAVFGPKGPGHSIGLVPTPGPGVGPYVRYLREDGNWTSFTPDTATLTNSMLATMAAKTIKANATSGTASPTDVSALTARSSSLLNLESVTTHGDSIYTMLATDRYVATSAALTSNRTWTLPLANSFNAGQEITISDDFAGIGSHTLSIQRQGSDLIEGKSAAVVLSVTRASITLTSDGTSKWSVVNRNPSIQKTVITSNGTYTTPTGCKAILIEALGAGGGGGGALGASSQASAASGGGAGGYVIRFESPPSATYAVTIGTGGAGGIGASDGTAGNGTDFGGVAQASGGNPGLTMATGTTALFKAGGLGQFASAGDWGSSGGDGEMGIRISGTVAASGAGGAASLYSGSTKGNVAQGDGIDANAARHFGGGGPGALSFNATPQTGGVGADGVVIVSEFY